MFRLRYCFEDLSCDFTNFDGEMLTLKRPTDGVTWSYVGDVDTF